MAHPAPSHRLPADHFERFARQKKVDSLIVTLELAAVQKALTPALAAYAVRHLTPADWSRAALVSGCRPPSEATIGLVVGYFELAAKIAARRAS